MGVDTNRVIDGPPSTQSVSKPSSATDFKYPKAPDAKFTNEATIEMTKQQTDPQVPGGSAFGHKYSAFVPANKVYDKIPANVANYYKQFQPWNQYYGPQSEYYNPQDVMRGNYVESDYDREATMNAANSPIFWPLQDAQRIDQRQINSIRANQPGNGYGSLPRKEQQPWNQGTLDYGLAYPRGVGNGAVTQSVGGGSGGFVPAPHVSNNKIETKPIEEHAKVVEVPNGKLDTTQPPTLSSTTPVADKPVVKPFVTYARLAANAKPLHASLAVSHLRDSSSTGRDTNSAVIALTLGLCICAMLVGLVGCRMKSIKRRIARRGGRSLTHDADYLVNRMYL